ncbi:MAG: heme ABC transporter substrate-binding protein IsdE [Firmicutes bacterium]|nr:heme ABC transporter substrate-binding protein IsdE [Bacillota bacterium]
MKKRKLLFVLFMIFIFCLSGCASSSANAPSKQSENIAANITEENNEKSENEIQTEENINKEVTEVPQTETITADISETESRMTTENMQTAKGGSGTGIDEDIKKKAETGEKQAVSHADADRPTETAAPKGTRIIATSAAVCDIMDRLGIELVGVPETTVSAIAARYDSVTRIGTPMGPDMEIVASLNPTDVIGPDTLKADLKPQYDNIGVNSTFLNLRSVQGLYDSVKMIGYKYGKEKEADEMYKEYETFIANYKNKHEGESPKVLVLMGLPGSYLVATQNSYCGSLVELAGGTNVFHDDTKDFLTINPEEMYLRDPDVIIRTAHGLPKEALEMFAKEFSENDIWKHFRAVQNNRVYDVDYMLFGMSATFDYPQALADLEPMLYPE